MVIGESKKDVASKKDLVCRAEFVSMSKSPDLRTSLAGLALDSAISSGLGRAPALQCRTPSRHHLELQDRRDYTPADRVARTCWLGCPGLLYYLAAGDAKLSFSPVPSTWPLPPRPHLISPKASQNLFKKCDPVTYLWRQNQLFNQNPITKKLLDSTLTPHRSLNTSRGVISEPDLLTTPDAEILDGFSDQCVIQASFHRLYSKAEKRYLHPVPSIRLEMEKEVQAIKTNKNIYVEARKLIVPQPSQTYAPATKSITVNNSSQTDENITKLKCSSLKLLQPLLSLPKSNTSISIPAVSTSSSSTQAQLPLSILQYEPYKGSLCY
ncbi:hypothetical protein TNCV_203871 [Trichonephila clavipes]|nr:hypothetical protein TNCV_203871 [Trichonephila clavipes]